MDIHSFNGINQVPLHAFWEDQVTEVTEITAGLVHATFLVRVAEKRYILQRVNTNVFKKADQVLENIKLVTQHLSSDSDYRLQVPKIVTTLSGQDAFITGTNDHWRCLSYIEGSTTKTSLSSTNEAFQVSQAFGSFAASLSTLEPQRLHCTIDGFHDAKGRLAQFETAITRGDPNRIAKVKTEILFLQKHYHIADQIIGLQLPTKIAHNDPKITNVLFDLSGQPLSIIDLDTVMPGSPLHDFGDLVRSMAASLVEDDDNFDRISIDRPIYDAIENGFRAGAGPTLSTIESDHLFLGAAYIIFEQAVRFLADYLQGDVYYRITHPEHNLVRARNQIALLQSFMESVYAIRKI